MKALPKAAHVVAGILLAGLSGLIVYIPWTIMEALEDFAHGALPRRYADIGLLLLIFPPPLIALGSLWWLVTRPKSCFFQSLGWSAMVTFLSMVSIHQAELGAEWRRTWHGQDVMKQEADWRAWQAARDRVMPQGKIRDLHPPLDQDEVRVLADQLRWPYIDAATLHRVHASVPKQLDCAIAQNSNALPDDLLSIWNEHICPDSYLAGNPNTPFDVLEVIFDAHPEGEADKDGRAARNGSAAGLAKVSCDPALLYSLFQLKDGLAIDTAAGLQMRRNMVRNTCTPWIIRKQMEKLPQLEQPADYQTRREYRAWSREIWVAQHWRPQR